jgi:hypothetical protein
VIGGRPHRRRGGLALLVGVLACLPVAPAGAAPGLRTGFMAGEFSSPDPAVRSPWLDRAVGEAAAVVRIGVDWSKIAPARRPAGFAPGDPGAAGYDWTAIDAAVRDAAARGLEPLLTVFSAPTWAEGPGRPAGAAAGAWRPDPGQLAAFARAAATRYSGAFADPLRPGGALPRVRDWQCWNEPNLALYLAPQWAARSGRLQPSSPAIYRALLNAFYAAVKGVDPSAVVVEAGTAPYGDPDPGGQRLFPAVFVRQLLCLSPSLRPAACPDPAHFDVLAHHPYAVAGPTAPALGRDDVSIPDLAKLTRPLAVAVRTGRALPRGPKRVWVTEFSWDSDPPDPQGVPAATQARWLEQAFEILWREGVDTLVWLNIRDAAPIPDYASTYQSGVFLRDGTPKPAAEAFRFPFVVHRATRTSVRVWGAAPGSGPVAIEIRGAGGAWRTLRQLPGPPARVFEANLPLRGAATLRGRVGASASLPWSVGA